MQDDNHDEGSHVWDDELQDYKYVPPHRGVFGEHLYEGRRRLKELLVESRAADPEFSISEANVWKKEDAEAGDWEWVPQRKPKVYHKRRKKDPEVQEMLEKAAAKWERRARRKKERKDAEKAAMDKILQAKMVNSSAVYCMWKAYSGTDSYYCSNVRARNPLTGHEERYCPYHVSLCLECGYKKREVQNPVERQNYRGLCKSCWQKVEPRPPPLFRDPLKVPGVNKVTAMRLRAMQMINRDKTTMAPPKDMYENKKNKEDISMRRKCHWIGKDKNGCRYRCNGRTIRDHTRGVLLRVCGWHQKTCIMPHAGRPVTIEIRNERGLCTSHYIAVTGRKPRKVSKFKVKTIEMIVVEEKKQERHPLAPRGAPPPEVRKEEAREARMYLGLPNSPREEEEEGGDVGGPVIEKDLIDYAFDRIAQMNSAAAKSIKDGYDSMNLWLYGAASAVRVQRLVRGYFKRTQYKKLIVHRVAEKRRLAAIEVQRRVRGYFDRAIVRAHKKEFLAGLAKIQKVARGFITRRRLARESATLTIQRVVRGFFAREDAKYEGVKREAENKTRDRLWAIRTVQRVYRGHIGRTRATISKKERQVLDKAASYVQSLWRGKRGREEFLDIKYDSDRREKVATFFQSKYKMKKQKVVFKKKMMEAFAAAQLIQKRMRGVLARKRAAEEREKVEKVWRWLNPTQPRRNFYYLMPKGHYGETSPAGTSPVKPPKDLTEEIERFLETTLDMEAYTLDDLGRQKKPYIPREVLEARAAAALVWPMERFSRYDEAGHGLLTKEYFRKGLESFGLLMSETQIWNTCRRFDLNQDGLVDYRLFVEYMRKKTIADAVLQYSKGRKITRGHMKRILRKPAKLTMPDTIRGTKLEETQLTMMYSRADLKIEGTASDFVDGQGRGDDRGGGTPRFEALELVPAEKVARYDGRVTEAFCALSEYIISQIIEEMENAQGAALGTTGWNSCPDPKLRRTGDIPKIMEHSHKKRGVGQVEKVVASVVRAKTAPGKSRSPNRADPKEYRDMMGFARMQKSLLQEELRDVSVSALEFDKTFKVMEPVPVVVDGVYGYTSEVGSLYVDILLTLLDPVKRILDNERECVEFILNRIIFMERHWKKLVHDIRTGTLDKHLELDPAIRREMEQMLRPEPKIAERLEEVLRELNFHKRASQAKGGKPGSDSVQIGIHAGPGHGGRENRASTAPIGAGRRRRKLRRKSLTSATLRKPLSQSLKRLPGLASSRLQLEARTSSGSQLPSSPTWTTGTIDANTVKLSPLGHEINVKRPLSAGGAVEADELPAGALIGMYGRFAGEPRNKPLPAVREARSVRAFVCKFPGCGRAFSDYRTLAAHYADEHHDKPRLRTPAPAVDQRVQSFWPVNVPWRQYTTKQLEKAEQTAAIGAPYTCMICNPPKRFARRDFYESHVRVIHPHAHKDMLVDPNVELLGMSLVVPPGKLPARAKPLAGADASEEEKTGGPPRLRPAMPLKVREGVSIRCLPLGGRVLTVLISSLSDPHSSGHCPVVLFAGQLHYANVLAICRDNLGRVMLACALFYNHAQMKKAGYAKALRPDFDEKFELVESHEVFYLPHTSVVEEAFVMTVSYNEFHKRRFSGALPSSESDRINPSDIDFEVAIDVGASVENSATVLEEEGDGDKESKKPKKNTKQRLRRVMFSREMFSFKDGKGMGLRDTKESLFANGFANPKKKKNRSKGKKGKRKRGGR